MMRAIINGCHGKMGLVLTTVIAESKTIEVVAGIDRNAEKTTQKYPVYERLQAIKEEADVIIDFSHPSYLRDMLDYGRSNHIPIVIATTGFSSEDINAIEEAAREIPILYSQNMSLGINLLVHLAKRAATALEEDFDIEIIEKHHNRKIDAPSGTAYMIAEGINKSLNHTKDYTFGREGKNELRSKNEIGIHAVRGGTIPGEHTVLFAGLDEIIELKHSALSKNIFALGAIKAARFIIEQKSGLYSMDDIFNFTDTTEK